MKKIILVISGVLISAGLTFGQSQPQQNNSNKTVTKTETKTEVKKNNNSMNGAIAKNHHMHKSTTTKKAKPRK
ncbi:MAG: hypothetical protein ACM3N9_02605 [Syntrophothermus sp.]